MALSIERNNFVSLQLMWKSIVDDMVAHGFEVELAAPDDGAGMPNIATANATHGDDTLLYVLKPLVAVDPLAATQEWRLVVRIEAVANGDAMAVSINAVTPTQILHDTDNNTFAIAAPGQQKESGILNPLGTSQAPGKYFFSRATTGATWGCFATGTDIEAVPISYRLSVTDHGFLLVTWAESHDNAGDCFNWVVVQRPIGADGQVLQTGHAPLFCVFSQNGGGSNDVNSVVASGINKFVVREDDVNAPTVPVSAVEPTADSSPIINPIQQVAIGENNKYILNFPQGLNTQRYSYPHELDLVCYTSADVISQYSEPQVTLYGEASPRKYKAMNANHENNKGMRLLVIVEGAGIPAA